MMHLFVTMQCVKNGILLLFLIFAFPWLKVSLHIFQIYSCIYLIFVIFYLGLLSIFSFVVILFILIDLLNSMY